MEVKRTKLEFNATIPIYLQIMDEFKRQIVSGEREPGGKVESVREIAQSMGVNPNTVQRAFAELEREGLMYAERTAGRFITEEASTIENLRKDYARSLIENFVGLMMKSGFSREDIFRLLKAYLEENENG